MGNLVAASLGFAVLVMVSSAGAEPTGSSPSSQGQTQGSSEAREPQSRPSMMGHGMMGHGMMGEMPCPPGMGHQMMGMGMGYGMMGGMMGTSDPKSMARMLKLRGDILKAIGEVMLKHAQALEQEK